MARSRTQKTLALSLGLTAGLAGLGRHAATRAQDDDGSVAFTTELSRLFDRWNDEAPKDRVAKAIELCNKRIKANAEDPEAWLELARLRLGTDELDAAQAAALRAERPGRFQEAKALFLIAYEAGQPARLVDLPRDEQPKLVAEYRKKLAELWAKLVETAGGEEKALRLVQDERERAATAATLDDLGRPAPPLGALDPAGGPPRIRVDTEGTPLRLDAYAGKVVLVDFWATWAKPYQAEVAKTLAVWQKQKDAGFEVIGVSLDTDRALVDAFLKDNKITWRQCFTGKGWGSDDVAKTWGVKRVPRRYLLDHTGRIRYVDVHGAGLEAAVQQLLDRAKKAAGKTPGKKD